MSLTVHSTAAQSDTLEAGAERDPLFASFRCSSLLYLSWQNGVSWLLGELQDHGVGIVCVAVVLGPQ